MKDASVTDLQLSQLVLLIVSLDDSDHLILTPILALACRAILSPQIYNLVSYVSRISKMILTFSYREHHRYVPQVKQPKEGAASTLAAWSIRPSSATTEWHACTALHSSFSESPPEAKSHKVDY